MACAFIQNEELDILHSLKRTNWRNFKKFYALKKIYGLLSKLWDEMFSWKHWVEDTHMRHELKVYFFMLVKNEQLKWNIYPVFWKI